MLIRVGYLRGAVLALGVLGVAACSGDTGNPGTGFGFGDMGSSATSAGCSLGEVFACTCADGTQSQQQCNTEGMLGECTCNGPAPTMMGEAMTNLSADGQSASGTQGATAGEGDPAGTEGTAADPSTLPTDGAAPAETGAEPAADESAMDMVEVTDTGDMTTTAADSEPALEDAAATDQGMTGVDPAELGDGSEVPATELCAAAATWDPEWSAWEVEVLALVNEYRAQGADCGSQGSFQAAEALTMNPILRCAARLHSLDMYERGFFDHTNPDGEDPFDRMAEAGYSGSSMGENIAQGQGSPQDVMVGWMGSDGHCSNIMSDNYTEIGVGYHPGEQDGFRNRNYWTQTFGAVRTQGPGGGTGFGGYQ